MPSFISLFIPLFRTIMLLFPLCFSSTTILPVKPILTNQNINSFLVQVLELNIPTSIKVSGVRIYPKFTNRYRPFFLYPLSTNAEQPNFDAGSKTYHFKTLSPGIHTFRIKSDWEYEDVIEIYISYESDSKHIPVLNNFTDISVTNTNYKYIPFLVNPVSILLFFPFHNYRIHLLMVNLLFLAVFSLSYFSLEMKTMMKIDVADNRIYASSYPIEKPDSWAYYDEDVFVKALNSKLNYSKCRLCDFKPAKQPKHGSTERDAIFQMTYGGDYDYLGLVSARTAGFKGKMFVFSDKSNFSERLIDCGIYHIPINVTLHSEFYHYNMRFPIMYQVLEKHAKHFDRILYADAGDTFFQADPFDFTDNALQISDENYPMVTEWCMQQWFAPYPGFNLKYFDPKTNITCSGIFGGSTDVIYNITRVVAGFWREGERGLIDQTVYDFVLESNISKKIGIKTKINPDLESRGIELRFHGFDQDWPVNPLGKFHNTRTGFYAAAIHQTNRKKPLHDLFRSQCK